MVMEKEGVTNETYSIIQYYTSIFFILSFITVHKSCKMWRRIIYFLSSIFTLFVTAV